MVQIAVHRPLAPVVGRDGATFAGFLFSGLLHEAVLSVPVGAGYGLPTLYFALHGALVLLEERLARRGKPLDARPVLGRVWTVAWVLLPVPLLFHPPFLSGVLAPLLATVPV